MWARTAPVLVSKMARSMVSRSGSPPMTNSYSSVSMVIAVVLPSKGRTRSAPGLDEVTCRQHCEGSRPRTDRLLIKPRRVGQAGAGSPRDRSNARHTRRWPVFSRVASYRRRQPVRSAEAGTTNTHSVLVAAALPGRVRVAEVDRDPGVDLELDVLGHLRALVPGQGLAQLGWQGTELGHDCVADRFGAVAGQRWPVLDRIGGPEALHSG